MDARNEKERCFLASPRVQILGLLCPHGSFPRTRGWFVERKWAETALGRLVTHVIIRLRNATRLRRWTRVGC